MSSTTKDAIAKAEALCKLDEHFRALEVLQEAASGATRAKRAGDVKALMAAMADAFAAMGDAEAAEHLRKELHDFAGGVYGMRLRTGTSLETLEVYKDSLQGADDRDPDVVGALHEMAEMCVELGRPGEAAEAYRRVLRADPGATEAMRALADVYDTLGEPEQARPLREQALAAEAARETATPP